MDEVRGVTVLLVTLPGYTAQSSNTYGHDLAVPGSVEYNSK